MAKKKPAAKKRKSPTTPRPATSFRLEPTIDYAAAGKHLADAIQSLGKAVDIVKPKAYTSSTWTSWIS